MIVNLIVKDLADNIAVSARHFGTLNPYTFNLKNAHDIRNGELRDISAVKSVKFYPHESFRTLVREKEKAFQEQEKVQENKTEKKK